MATKKQREQSEALAYLCEWSDEILEPSSFLEFSTEYTKGITDYVSVSLYYQKDGRGHKADLTYNVGKACGYSFRANSNQLALGGGGYSKSYDVMLSMFRAMGIERDKVNYTY